MGRRRFIRYPDTQADSTLSALVRRNLLRSPSFELGPGYTAAGASVTLAQSGNEYAHAYGDYGLAVQGSSSPVSGSSTFFQDNDPAFPAVEGGIYRASILLRRANTITGLWARIYISFRDATNTQVGTAFSDFRELTTPAVRDQVPLTVESGPAPAGTAIVRVVVQFSGGTTASTNPPGGFYAHADGWILEQKMFAVSAVGDSLVRGYTGSTAWPLEDAWPALMQPMLPGSTVINRGWGGQCADTVRFLWPSINPTMIPAGGAIPAAVEPVACTSLEPFAFGENELGGTGGTLGGVPGVMTYTAADGFVFTRTAAGGQVTIPAGAPFVVARPDERENVVVVWFGRNDINQQVTGQEGRVASHVVASFTKIVEEIGHGRYVLIPPMNQSVETAGTEHYAQVVEIETRLRDLFGEHVLDIRSWFVQQAIYDLGMTPTTADLEAMAADAPPPSITDGGSHYIQPVAPLIAQQVADKITTLDLDTAGTNYFDGDTPAPGWDLRTNWTADRQASASELRKVTRPNYYESTPLLVTGLEDEYVSRAVELEPIGSVDPIIVYPYRAASAPARGTLEALFSNRDEAQQLIELATTGLIAYQDEEYAEYEMVMHARTSRRTYLTGHSTDYWTVLLNYTRVGPF